MRFSFYSDYVWNHTLVQFQNCLPIEPPIKYTKYSYKKLSIESFKFKHEVRNRLVVITPRLFFGSKVFRSLTYEFLINARR